MLTFQGQSAVLCFSIMPHLSEYIFEIYVVCCRVKGGDRPGILWIIRKHQSQLWSIPQQKEYLSVFDFQLEINKMNGEIDKLLFSQNMLNKIGFLWWSSSIFLFLVTLGRGERLSKHFQVKIKQILLLTKWIWACQFHPVCHVSQSKLWEESYFVYAYR